MTTKLKVGDKVYNKNHWRYSDKYSYIFSEVERLTSTMAVLKNEVKLINESAIDHWDTDKTPHWKRHGERSEQWKLVTDAIIEDDKIVRYNNSAINWVDSQRFTNEQKIKIYKLFND